MSENNSNYDAAVSQAKQSGRSSPDLVPTGDYIGRSENEVERVLELMRGGMPEDEIMGRESAAPEPPQEAPPQEEFGTIEELLDETPEGQPQPTMESVLPEAEGSQTIKIGDREVALDTLRDWEDSYRNAQGMVEAQQQATLASQQEKQMWRESLNHLKDNPVEGLQALGLTPSQIAEKMKEAGIVENQQRLPEEENYADLRLDEDAPDVVRQLAAQNKNLARQIQAGNARHEELLSRFDQQSQNEKDQEIHNWRNGRLSASADYLKGIVDKSSNLDGHTKALLMRATMADVERGIDAAPLDEPGLREWAKGRLKSALDETRPEDVARAAATPEHSSIPTRVGETPRGENSQESWDKADVADDEGRKRGALAWLDHHARNM